jgi:hypothetical protein
MDQFQFPFRLDDSSKYFTHRLTCISVNILSKKVSKIGINFADKQQSLGQYSSLTDSGHKVCFRIFDHICVDYDRTSELIVYVGKNSACKT